MGIRRAVLDVLIPIKGLGIEELGTRLESVHGVDSVNITVKEFDVSTQTLLVVVEGEDIDMSELRNVFEEFGAAIHGIDQIVAGKRIAEIPDYFYEL
ncbi:MAG: DUF211 domain-containing protein [Thermoprotei archaeon]|jgi:hypothetical protein|uniref:DUF211 domain-containing protein n=1 Tax=Fervidicoccus fontis TaxID=683846 RepID=A0A7J3SJA3_9CREN|nr:DUF211 domain-containing protein [Thermoprotei archaeon]